MVLIHCTNPACSQNGVDCELTDDFPPGLVTCGTCGQEIEGSDDRTPVEGLA